MSHIFWTQSGASLREHREKNAPIRHKKQTVASLQNAYGRLAFQIREGRIRVYMSRKQEFAEPIHGEEQERILQERQAKAGEGRVITDTHDPQVSAASYEERQREISPEKAYRNLRRAVQVTGQRTMEEMLPDDRQLQKKVFENLKFTAEQARKQKSSLDSRPRVVIREETEESELPADENDR